MKRAALALLFLVAACEKRAPDAVPAEALDAIAIAAAEELNGPPAAIQTLVRQSSETAQVGWDKLVIGFDGKNIPVGGWLYRHGYLDLAGVQYVTRPLFALTKTARAQLLEPDAPWFEAEAGEPTSVDCNSEAALTAGGCEVEVVLTPVLTPAGKVALGAVKLPTFTVRAVAVVGLDGWEVPTFNSMNPTAQDVALNAILGPEENRQAASAAVLKELQSRLGLDAQTDAAPPVTNYVEPDPPVLPE